MPPSSEKQPTMNLFPTRKRNVLVIIQVRDLNEIRPRLETALKKFDRTVLEVMPGVWHLATIRKIVDIRSAMVNSVTGYEDDRMLVLDNSDGFAGWDGHKNQHCRSLELAERFVQFFKNMKGKWVPHQRRNLQPAKPPVWVVGEYLEDV